MAMAILQSLLLRDGVRRENNHFSCIVWLISWNSPEETDKGVISDVAPMTIFVVPSALFR